MVGVGLAVALWSAPAWAANADVEAGKAAFLKGEFRQALVKLEEASRSPNATEDDVVEIHWFRGASFHALGKKADADKSFDALLAVRPLYAPNKMETPPDIRAAFKKRGDAYMKVHGINVAAPALDAARLVVALDGPGLGEAASVVFSARAVGDVQYAQANATVEDGKAAAVISDAGVWERAGKGGQLQVVVEVRNARGTPVARAGDAVQPLAVTITAEQADAARKAITPEKPATTAATEDPKTETTPGASSTTTTTNAAPADKPADNASAPSPLRTVLLGTGGVLLGLAALPALVGLVCVLGLGASAALFGVTYWQFGQYGADKQRDALAQRWTFGQYGAAGFGVGVAAALGLVALLAVPGVITLVVRAVL